MAGNSSVNLAGSLRIATSRRLADVAISQVIDNFEVVQFDFNVPISANNITVPLTFPSGVTEANFLHIYSPAKLVLELVSSDATTPGPWRVGVKGHMMLTCQPGEGIVSLKVTNPSANSDYTIEVVLGVIPASVNAPDFFTDG